MDGNDISVDMSQRIREEEIRAAMLNEALKAAERQARDLEKLMDEPEKAELPEESGHNIDLMA